ncbi:hypothetical protein SCHPADRAFT_892296 [Schizopora paradoxa]|uniref:Uncharacterized protein n=1 Tax=Schizopora paradoxa TaxID=27342 RepID=A0A0H2S0I8_9AGAM|nr:hypothetical protein SCHPADRAFT_892296 [Schizopora paradoxa]
MAKSMEIAWRNEDLRIVEDLTAVEGGWGMGCEELSGGGRGSVGGARASASSMSRWALKKELGKELGVPSSLYDTCSWRNITADLDSAIDNGFGKQCNLALGGRRADSVIQDTHTLNVEMKTTGVEDKGEDKEAGGERRGGFSTSVYSNYLLSDSTPLNSDVL